MDCGGEKEEYTTAIPDCNRRNVLDSPFSVCVSDAVSLSVAGRRKCGGGGGGGGCGAKSIQFANARETLDRFCSGWFRGAGGGPPISSAVGPRCPRPPPSPSIKNYSAVRQRAGGRQSKHASRPEKRRAIGTFLQLPKSCGCRHS